MSRRGVLVRLCLSFLDLLVKLAICCCWFTSTEAVCIPKNGCSRALASYWVQTNDKLSTLVSRFQTTIAEVQKYNNITDSEKITLGQQILFPFPCGCVSGRLGYNFVYQVQAGDTVGLIASSLFGNLSTQEWIASATHLENVDYIVTSRYLKVPVNCSCGDLHVSSDYGLFMTYPAHTIDTLSSVASSYGISDNLMKQYNPTVNYGGNLTTQDIVFIPAKDASGVYPPYNSSDDVNEWSGNRNKNLIIGVSVGGCVALVASIGGLVWLCCVCLPKDRAGQKDNEPGISSMQIDHSSGETRRSGLLKLSGEGISRSTRSSTGSGPSFHGGPFSDFTVDKSVEFSFEELAAATNNFSVANKIGEGGYGAVYFANLRGQVNLSFHLLFLPTHDHDFEAQYVDSRTLLLDYCHMNPDLDQSST